MNKAMLILCVSGVLALIGCTSSQTTPTVSTEMPNGLTASMIVHGLSCPLCANNLDRYLMTVPGVEGVKIDLGAGRVTVQIASGTIVTPIQLEQAVKDSGFTFKTFEGYR